MVVMFGRCNSSTLCNIIELSSQITVSDRLVWTREIINSNFRLTEAGIVLPACFLFKHFKVSKIIGNISVKMRGQWRLHTLGTCKKWHAYRGYFLLSIKAPFHVLRKAIKGASAFPVHTVFRNHAYTYLMNLIFCVLTYAIIYVLIHQIIFPFHHLKYSFFSSTLVLTSSIDVVFIPSIALVIDAFNNKAPIRIRWTKRITILRPKQNILQGPHFSNAFH